MTTGGNYNFGGEKFGGGIPYLGISPAMDHALLRAEVRRSFHNCTAARSMVMTFVDGVVGTGLIPKPKPAASILGISQEQAEEWARDVRERFQLWAESKQCTSAEDMTFGQLQRLVSIQAERDGEYFARLNFFNDADRISSLSVQLLEQNQINGNAYTVTQGMPWTRDGIERDARGRETGYQVWVRNADGIVKGIRVPARSGGRRIMLHGFTPEYAGQGRGYAPLAHALQEFAQITGFQLAHIQKAILQATITVAKETAAGQTPTGNPFSGAGPSSCPLPPPPSGGAAPIPGSAPPYAPVDAQLALGGIGVFNLGSGEKLVPLGHTAPADNYGPFLDAFIKALAASARVPVSVVLLAFSNNYSASRAEIAMAFRTFMNHRSELISDFCGPVLEAWLSEEIAAGRITARGWSDPTMRAAWLAVDWSGPEMIDIDPEKSVNASRLALETGLTDIQTEAHKYNGSDASTNIATNARIFPTLPAAPWAKSQTAPVSQDNGGTQDGATGNR